MTIEVTPGKVRVICSICDAGPPLWSNWESPFHCSECGACHFPLQIWGGKVCLWEIEPPETDRGIWIPESAREPRGHGVLLSVGKGYLRNFAPEGKDPKFKYWHTDDMLQVNRHVLFDEGTPWKMEAVGLDGKMHAFRLMGALDIKCVKVED